MKLSFKALKKFFPYLSEESKQFFLSLGNANALDAERQWEDLRRRLSHYPITGPLGSQDPLLPVDVKHLLSKLTLKPADDLNVFSKMMPKMKTNLQQKWRKRDLSAWFNPQSERRNLFTPGKRAAATLSRIRHLGDMCIKCSRDRTRNMAALRTLRVELRLRFKEIHGDCNGMTVGLYLKNLGPLWIEIVMMTRR